MNVRPFVRRDDAPVSTYGMLSDRESKMAAGARVVRDERIDLRTTSEIKDILVSASKHVGINLTDFIVQRALQDAREILAKKDRVDATAADVEFVLDLLDNPPEPTPALIKAAHDWRGS
jgi:uncharacterized protein (DUF1778 family)